MRVLELQGTPYKKWLFLLPLRYNINNNNINNKNNINNNNNNNNNSIIAIIIAAAPAEKDWKPQVGPVVAQVGPMWPKIATCYS